jgi:hypothetical protein
MRHTGLIGLLVSLAVGGICACSDGDGGGGSTAGNAGADASASGGSSAMGGNGAAAGSGATSATGGDGGQAGGAGQAGGEAGQAGSAGDAGSAGEGAGGQAGASGGAGGDAGSADAGWDATGSTNDCCVAAQTVGCNDPAIEACVCKMDGACCVSAWDAICVNDVSKYGCGSCPDAGIGGAAGTGGASGAAGASGASGSGGAGGATDGGACPGTIVDGICVYLASAASMTFAAAESLCQGLGTGWGLCSPTTLCSSQTLSYLGAAGCDCNGGATACACGTAKNLYFHVSTSTSQPHYIRTALVPNCDWAGDACTTSTTIKCGAALCCL